MTEYTGNQLLYIYAFMGEIVLVTPVRYVGKAVVSSSEKAVQEVKVPSLHAVMSDRDSGIHVVSDDIQNPGLFLSEFKALDDAIQKLQGQVAELKGHDSERHLLLARRLAFAQDLRNYSIEESLANPTEGQVWGIVGSQIASGYREFDESVDLDLITEDGSTGGHVRAQNLFPTRSHAVVALLKQLEDKIKVQDTWVAESKCQLQQALKNVEDAKLTVEEAETDLALLHGSITRLISGG